MNLNLKSNGAIAKYLGFCTYQPTYHPASFCSLFWMLGFSPIIFAGCSIIAGANHVTDQYEAAVNNSLNRQARALVHIYLKNPVEALQDFKEIFMPCPYYIKALRNYEVVNRAFVMLAEQFGDKEMRYFLVLASLGAVPDDEVAGWDFMRNHPYRDQQTTNKSAVSSFAAEMRNAYGTAILIAVFTFTFSLLFSLVLYVNIVPSSMAMTVIPALLITLFYRTESNVVVANLYRAVKDKTCPIISWKE